MKFILKDTNHFYDTYKINIKVYEKFLKFCDENQNKIFDTKNCRFINKNFIYLDQWSFDINRDVINLNELKLKLLEKYL